MVVALNSDASVRRQGRAMIARSTPRRPPGGDGLLGCVDLVTWFDEDTPIARILECQPDVLVKGGDWPVDRIVGAPKPSPGAAACIPSLEHQRSTTSLLEKIRRL